MKFKACLIAFALLPVAILPGTAMAYVGPGAGISLIGSTIGLLVALGAALGFVLLWPLRSLMRRRSRAPATAGGEDRPHGHERR